MIWKQILQVRHRTLHEMRLWLKNELDKGHIQTSSKLRLSEAGLAAWDGEADKFMLRFLRAQKFDVKKAQKMLHSNLRLRTQKPQWFDGISHLHGWEFVQFWISRPKLNSDADWILYQIFGFRSSDVSQLLHKGFMTVLPNVDKEGRIVVLNWAAMLDPNKISKEVCIRIYYKTNLEFRGTKAKHIKGSEKHFKHHRKLMSLSLAVMSHLVLWSVWNFCSSNGPILREKKRMVERKFGK